MIFNTFEIKYFIIRSTKNMLNLVLVENKLLKAQQIDSYRTIDITLSDRNS